ncbi:MAG: polysaccharide biosynthesis tyrosine autokinase [Gemmatimonas sp.]
MSGKNNHPVAPPTPPVEVYSDNAELANWSPADAAPAAAAGPNMQRYLSALGRFKWLILFMTAVGAGAGYVATKFVDPEYEVESNITLDLGSSVGPAQNGGFQDNSRLDESSWIDLLRSYAVIDPVVMKQKLYLEPDNEGDSALFRDFNVTSQLIGGDYTLKVDDKNWRLLLDGRYPKDSGLVGDSIGRSRGFAWQPTSVELAGVTSASFSVVTPREASRKLVQKLDPKMGTGKQAFLNLKLTGKNSHRLAATLNSWTEQFMGEAFAMKKLRVAFMANLLEGQRQYASEALTQVESELQNFRVRTITEPNERVQQTMGVNTISQPTVVNDYLAMNATLLNMTRDRTNLEDLLKAAREKKTPLASVEILSIPSINLDPAAQTLKKRLDEQDLRATEMRKILETRREAEPAVKQMQASLDSLQLTIVPRELSSYVSQIKLKEAELQKQIAVNGETLKDIPKRTIAEMQLSRRQEEAVKLFTSLDVATQSAKLSEAGTIPDIQVKDTAIPPTIPASNTAPVLILGAIAVALALGIALSILLDQTDKRFRYPEQATRDLGLYILGVVPVIGSKGRRGVEQAAQVVETFRSIRMNVRYATEPGRALTLTITSPGPNDGKSLISSNLALSFAEAGARTLLIDGDIRRGELSKTFGTPAKPGLVEYLDGSALVDEVLQPTASHPNLTIMPGGARRRRAPELLATPKLPQLIAQLAREYDVIVVDSPPLGAGFDAFALGTATTNMAIVLRAGVTDRKLAKAKLATIEQLPIRLIGTVLNSIKLAGAYQYYSYYQDYAAEDEEPVAAPRLAARNERPSDPVSVD